MTGQTLPPQLSSACRPDGEGVWECTYRDRSYSLVVPGSATTLVVFLHGSGRNHRTLLEDPATRATLAAGRSVVLMPEGRSSWWIAPGYPEFVIELTEQVAGALGIPPGPRGCGGWSMGAYGSVRLLEEYPGAFASWTGILGLLDFPNPGYAPADNHSVPSVLGPPRDWPRHNPMNAIEKLRGRRLWFTTGKSAFDLRMNQAFHQKLEGLGIAHEFTTLEGGHVFSVVAQALPAALRFHERALN